jgi:NAD(P)-dependent dehydrogenase (short-subunit alcohol dehydrogenase family)
MGMPPAESGYAFPGFENLRNDIYPSISASSTPALHQPGKIVLITGAGRGCGRAMALQYAHAGVAAIILVARTTSQLDEVESSIKSINDSIRVHKFSVDVTNEDAVSSLAETVKEKEGGRLDILVNNAGTGDPWVPLAESTPKDYWKTLEVNFKGPYLFLHAFLPLLVETAAKYSVGTNVVNVTSIGAVLVLPTASSYGTSKLALQRLTEFVNLEYGDKGVVAVGIHPGGVETALSKDVEAMKGRKFIFLHRYEKDEAKKS